MNYTFNETYDHFGDHINFLQSINYIYESRKLNVYATLFVIIIGLIGNSITIVLFAQKRFRTNSNNVFLLCLAINDSLFLVLHLFEDTIRTYQELYPIDDNHLFINTLIKQLNIIDQYEMACSLINYFRYVLRFISAYIIVAFTIQRLSIVMTPLSKKYKSKRFAWITVLSIILFALLINLWVVFAFKVHADDETHFCEIKKAWKTRYFILTNFYLVIIILLPLLAIFISNILIIFKTKKASKKRKSFISKRSFTTTKGESLYSSATNNSSVFKSRLMSNLTVARMSGCSSNSTMLNVKRLNSMNSFRSNLYIRRPALSINKFDFKIKPVYQNVKQITTNKTTSNCLITKMLILVSFSYAFLNLPYLITWCIFYNEITFEIHGEDSLVHNTLFLAVKISEIFNILNYGVHFYFYCVSGSMFWNQLKYSSKNLTIFHLLNNFVINS